PGEAKPVGKARALPSGSGRGSKISIKDVADLADVSIATVSRVLNNPSLVAAPTAERVMRAVDQLGYRPNLFAKGLMTRRSRILGVSLPDWSGDSYADLMRGADERARELGYHLLVSSNAHQSGGDGLPPAFALDLVDGLIAMVTSRDGHDFDALNSLEMPVLLMTSSVEESRLDTIEIDNYTGAREAALHLADGTDGSRCYFVGGPGANRDASRRAAAFRDALAERGHAARSDQINHGSWSFEWGWQWAGRMIDEGKLDGAAVLAGNDEIAIGIGHRARDAGLAVPEHLRLVGFDDSRSCAFLLPPLSSVRVPNRLVGAEAVSTLVRRLDEPEIEPVSRRIETSLVIRESSEF
ncbi:MAG: LacI family DNA-binding transcriptional regulator, partial [Planctomycetota bacterium]